MNKLNIFLLILVLGSGLAVVTVQDRARDFYIALGKAQKQETLLNEDHARLLLAQAKLANHNVIKAAALKQSLHAPDISETRILNQ